MLSFNKTPSLMEMNEILVLGGRGGESVTEQLAVTVVPRKKVVLMKGEIETLGKGTKK